eukprot:4432152-Lingulodinium_polyedra.AAC.1
MPRGRGRGAVSGSGPSYRRRRTAKFCELRRARSAQGHRRNVMPQPLAGVLPGPGGPRPQS